MKDLVATIHSALIRSGAESSEPAVEDRIGDYVLDAVWSDKPASIPAIYAAFGLEGP